jgi:ATP-dependent helicase/nuclease subunit A
MRAAERGRLIHALFERLPSVAADRRAAALRWLDRAGPGFTPDERAAMVGAVLVVLDDPAHAALFGAASLAEVPFSALVDGRVIAGTVDRLVVDDERVLIVDFKTGAAVPETAEGIAPGYLAQMGAYAAALGVVFAGRRVEAALLYTAGPRLLTIPPALLDAHKPRFAGDKANSPTAA